MKPFAVQVSYYSVWNIAASSAAVKKHVEKQDKFPQGRHMVAQSYVHLNNMCTAIDDDATICPAAVCKHSWTIVRAATLQHVSGCVTSWQMLTVERSAANW